MFIRYVEGDYGGKAVVLSKEEIEYYCHIIPIIMASVYNHRFPINGGGFLDYNKNPVCLRQIRIKSPRYILFSGNSVEELARAVDFLGLLFDAEKVCKD